MLVSGWKLLSSGSFVKAPKGAFECIEKLCNSERDSEEELVGEEQGVALLSL